MKTTDVFFKDTNFVGREVENVQDLVKAVAAGMNIADAEGNGYTSGYDDEDEDGDWFWHEKTEEELFAEMRADLDNGSEVYAGFFINCRDYSIKPAAATTLQSKFNLGQEVFAMRRNKIIAGKIVYISLSACSYKQDLLLDEKARNLSEIVFETIASEINPRFTNYYCLKKRYDVEDEYKKVFKDNYVLIGVKDDSSSLSYYTYGLNEIFATKEELVNHLMKEG